MEQETKEQRIALQREKDWDLKKPVEYFDLRRTTVAWVRDWAFKVLETGRFSFAEVYQAGTTCSVSFK